jgi:hypothetical protein
MEFEISLLTVQTACVAVADFAAVSTLFAYHVASGRLQIEAFKAFTAVSIARTAQTVQFLAVSALLV